MCRALFYSSSSAAFALTSPLTTLCLFTHTKLLATVVFYVSRPLYYAHFKDVNHRLPSLSPNPNGVCPWSPSPSALFVSSGRHTQSEDAFA